MSPSSLHPVVQVPGSVRGPFTLWSAVRTSTEVEMFTRKILGRELKPLLFVGDGEGHRHL